MHKFIKLFSRPNAPGSENKCKTHTDSLGKRKIVEKNKKVEKTKSNSSENLLATGVPKRNVNSVDNLDEAKEAVETKDALKEKENAVSLESVFSEENFGNMDGKRASGRSRILKTPSSSNILLLKKDSERLKSGKISPTKPATLKNLPEPKVNEMKR